VNSREFVESNQRFTINLMIGLVVWIFSMAAFLPITTITSPDWGKLIAIILTIDITYYLYKAKTNSKPLFKYLSNRLATNYLTWRKLDANNLPTVRRNIKKTLSIILTVLIYIMYRPLLYAISPILAGIVFIPLLLIMIKQVIGK